MVGESRPLLPVVLRPLGVANTAPFRLAGGSCFVGSGKGAHVMVNEPTVSRQHCEVELCAGGVRVTDLDSKNGTFYLGQRIDAIVLPAGATFSIGNVSIAIQPDADPREVEPNAEPAFGEMLGASVAMRRLFAVVHRLRTSVVPVLIEGESGVGKETLARTLHAASPVGSAPFVSLRCGSLPRDLLALELFGQGDRQGAFERAAGGTVYLDGIESLPLDLQLALLEVLERGEVRPVDLAHTRPTRFRLVTSSTKSIEEEARNGIIREPLFFRISTVRLHVPPLRERREDISGLAELFAGRAGVTDLPSAVMEDLKTRTLPGNLRELESLMLAYAALGALPAPSRVRGSLLEVAFDEIIDPQKPYVDQKDELVERFTRRYLQELLRHTSGNQSVAARLAGLDRTYLGRLVARYQMK